MLAGPMAREVTSTFDAFFWNSEHSCPRDAVRSTTRGCNSRSSVTSEQLHRTVSGTPRVAPVHFEPSDWCALSSRTWSRRSHPRAASLWESPDILDASRPRLYDSFKELVASAQREVLICSPYFIPDSRFRELIRTSLRVACASRS